jgi:hypothetical protein
VKLSFGNEGKVAIAPIEGPTAAAPGSTPRRVISYFPSTSKGLRTPSPGRFSTWV